MAAEYRVKVKNGDYGYNLETGLYGDQDLIVETDNIIEALRTFFDYTEGAEVGDKTTLTFRYKKDKVKNKK